MWIVLIYVLTELILKVLSLTFIAFLKIYNSDVAVFPLEKNNKTMEFKSDLLKGKNYLWILLQILITYFWLQKVCMNVSVHSLGILFYCNLSL